MLWNTLVFGLASSLIAIPAGVALAFLSERTDVRGRVIIQSLLLGMLFVPVHVQVAAWNAGFGLNGCVSQWLGSDVVILDGWVGAVWVHAVTSLPWVQLIAGIGLRRIAGRFEEEASLYGHPVRVLWRVTLPMSLPAILAAVVWVFLGAANEIAVTDVYQVRTYAEEIYTGFALGDDLAEVQSRVLPGIAIVAAIVTAAMSLGKSLSPSGYAIPASQRFIYRLGPWRSFATAALWAFMAFIVLVPVVSLIWNAGVDVRLTDSGRVRIWSLRKLISILAASPFEFADEIAWSVVLGQASSVAAVVLAFIFALARSRWSRLLGASLALAGISIPAPILALAVARVINSSESPVLAYLYDYTIFSAWLVLLVRSFPLAFVLAQAAANTIDVRIHEAAELDGASWPMRLWKIDLPLLGTSIAGTWIVCLAWGMAELSGTIMSLPPGVSTLSIRLFNLVHYGVDDQLAGICLVHLIVCALLAALGIKLLKGRLAE